MLPYRGIYSAFCICLKRWGPIALDSLSPSKDSKWFRVKLSASSIPLTSLARVSLNLLSSPLNLSKASKNKNYVCYKYNCIHILGYEYMYVNPGKLLLLPQDMLWPYTLKTSNIVEIVSKSSSPQLCHPTLGNWG